jgi:hypothetical protein
MKHLPTNAKVFGVIDGFPWWVDSGPTARFQAAMKDAGLTQDDFGNSAYTATWSSLETFRTAMSKAPAAPTSADVFAGMYSLKDQDLGGLLPQKVNFTAGKPSPPMLCYWYYKYENGKFATAPDTSSSGNSATSGDLKSSCFNPKA